MTIDEAIANIKTKSTSVSPAAVFRIQKMSDEEARISVYTAADHLQAITDATRDMVIQLLSNEGLDIQVFAYDIATTTLPPE